MGSYREILAAVPLMLLLTEGCGTTPQPGAHAAPAERTPALTNDPDVREAVRVLYPLLREQRFADSFAGIVVENHEHRLVIYRLPDPKLDAAVRAANPGATVVLRAAKYPLREMERIRDLVMGDVAYWRKHGIEVRSGGPMADGSGVMIGTAKGASAERAALVKHYDTEAILVEKAGRAVPA